MRSKRGLGWLVLALVACGAQNARTDGNGGGGGGGDAAVTGGTTSTGGATPSRGGAPSTGGATASGGAMATGGTSSSGGSAGASVSSLATGGAAGAGGLAAAGGKTSGGGSSGHGGTVAAGGATASGGATTSTTPTDAGSSSDARDASDAAGAREVSSANDAMDAPPATSTCPATSTLKTGDNKLTLQFGGRTRNYTVYVPSAVKAGTAVPLVFHFHGHGADAAQEASSSGWKAKADRAGFILAYPEGVDSSWNVGSCCGLAMSENVDDVGFTKAMIQAIGKAACIDAKRVYAAGMSNGAGFVHRLGCEAADVIAAIAPASADLVTDPCTPVRPISVLAVRGLADTMVKYEGGKTGSTGWYDPGAKQSLELWKKIDQCTGAVTAPRQYCESYTQCGAGVENTLCSLPDTGHDTYNNAVKMSVPDVAWEMFQRQPMP